MGRLNPSGDGATVSASGVPEELIAEFDDWWEQSDYDSRSQAIRGVMREAVDGPVETTTPLVPPDEDRLEWGYRKLCAAANGSGVIKTKRAKRVCSNGPENLTKEEVPDLVLHPLRRRGYVRRLSNLYGAESWAIVGWEDQ